MYKCGLVVIVVRLIISVGVACSVVIGGGLGVLCFSFICMVSVSSGVLPWL